LWLGEKAESQAMARGSWMCEAELVVWARLPLTKGEI
jgi:hypothetical protein